MSLIEISLVGLVPLVLIGGMAAALFGFIYGIVKKRPGVIAASVAAPFLLLVGGFLFVGLARFTAEQAKQTPTVWTPTVQAPFMPAMQHVHFGVSSSPSWIKLALIVVVVLVIAKCVAYRGDANVAGFCRGAGKAALLVSLVLLVVVAARFYRQRESEARRDVATQQMRVAMDIHQHVAADPTAQRVVDQVAQQSGGLNEQSIQAIWEKLNEPRIKLEAKDVETVQEAGVGPHPGGLAESGVPRPVESPETLANTVARLERMVAQVSAVADQVSDTGTLIGKAMIALNETMDSRRKNSSTPAPTAAVPAVQVAAVQSKDAENNAVVAKAEDELEIDDDAVVGSTSAPRPAWVDEAPKNVGNVRRQVLVAGEFATREECDREMDLQLFRATYNRIQEVSNSGEQPLEDSTMKSSSGGIQPLRGAEFAALQLGRSGIVGIDFIRREIAKDEHRETVVRSFGPMKKLYTQIEFSPSIDQELLRRWDEFRRSERFAQVGAGAGSVLGLIGLAFGLLRVDTWTKGYYSKRLFLGVPAAIIGAITLLLVAAG